MRLQNLVNSKQSLESEVRKLKLTLNEERTARQNGVANHNDEQYENERELIGFGRSSRMVKAFRRLER